jgi:hypothetical protein
MRWAVSVTRMGQNGHVCKILVGNLRRDCLVKISVD